MQIFNSFLESFLDLFQKKIRTDVYRNVEFQSGRVILETVNANTSDIFCVSFFEYNGKVLGKIKLGCKKNVSFYINIKEAQEDFDKRVKALYLKQ